MLSEIFDSKGEEVTGKCIKLRRPTHPLPDVRWVIHRGNQLYVISYMQTASC
jgi:hypothetical protein